VEAFTIAKIAIFVKAQHFAYANKLVVRKYAKFMPDLTNAPNRKYVCQPSRKNAKLKKFGIKIYQLATLHPYNCALFIIIPAVTEVHVMLKRIECEKRVWLTICSLGKVEHHLYLLMS